MEFKLTKKYQYNKRCKDGHRRSYLIYFLNSVQILKQKIPFDESYEAGHDHKTRIVKDYLLNGCIHQIRISGYDYFNGEEIKNFQRQSTLIDTLEGEKKKHTQTKTISWLDRDTKIKQRKVKFPISKKILNELNVPNNLIIEIS